MIDFKHRAFAAKIIDNGQYSKASAVVEAVRYEIHGPMLVDPFGPVHDHPEVADTFLAFLQAKRKAFFLVKTFGTLVVDYTPLPTQQYMQPGRAELAAMFSKFSQA